MTKLMKLACAALLVAMAVPMAQRVQARSAASANHFACARFGLTFSAPANWSRLTNKCGSGEVQADYLSEDHNGVLILIGFPERPTTMKVLLSLAHDDIAVYKFGVKNAPFSTKVINGVQFLETSRTGSNAIFQGSAWNLLALTQKNGLVLSVFGMVNRSGNANVSGEIRDITNALSTIRFTKPGKAAMPAPAPKAPTDVCDPDSHVCASANNLHQDSGGDIPPPSGQQFVVVHVKLVNNGSQSADYNTLDFVLKGADTHVDYQADAIDINITNTSLNSGTLLAGDIVEGDIAFQAPSSENSYSLIWQPNIMNDAMAVPIN